MHRAVIGQKNRLPSLCDTKVLFIIEVVPNPGYILYPFVRTLPFFLAGTTVIYQHLRSSRDAAKANIPLNGRLATMKASRDNLIRLGRVEEAEKVQSSKYYHCAQDRTPYFVRDLDLNIVCFRTRELKQECGPSLLFAFVAATPNRHAQANV